MSDNTKPWTAEQLADLNSAWFRGAALRTCDTVSGRRCVALRARPKQQFAPIERIVWGWLGGSADSGVMWCVENDAPRKSRVGLPWSVNELRAVERIKINRIMLPQQLAAQLTDAYIAHLLNREKGELPVVAKPLLGVL